MIKNRLAKKRTSILLAATLILGNTQWAAASQNNMPSSENKEGQETMDPQQPIQETPAGMREKQEETRWELDTCTVILNGHTLEVSGSSVPDFEEDAAPWQGSLQDAVGIVIEEGIQRIGDYAFSKSINAREVLLPDTLQEIGEGSFQYNAMLGEVTFPAGLEKIGKGAFAYSPQLKEVTGLLEMEMGKEAFAGCPVLQVPNNPWGDGSPAGSNRVSLEIQAAENTKEHYGTLYLFAAELERAAGQRSEAEAVAAVKEKEGSHFYGLSGGSMEECLKEIIAGERYQDVLSCQASFEPVQEEDGAENTLETMAPPVKDEENQPESLPLYEDGETAETGKNNEAGMEENVPGEEKESPKESRAEADPFKDAMGFASQKLALPNTSLFMGSSARGRYAVGWNSDSSGWWYSYDGKNYYTNTWAWLLSGDDWDYYYFGGDGYMLTSRWIGESYVDGSGYCTVTGASSSSDVEKAFLSRHCSTIRLLNTIFASTVFDSYRDMAIEGPGELAATDSSYSLIVVYGGNLTVRNGATLSGNRIAPNVIEVKYGCSVDIYGNVYNAYNHADSNGAGDGGHGIRGDNGSLIRIHEGANVHSNAHAGVASFGNIAMDGGDVQNNQKHGIHVNGVLGGCNFSMSGGRVHGNREIGIVALSNSNASVNLSGGYAYSNGGYDVQLLQGAYGSIGNFYIGILGWVNDDNYSPAPSASVGLYIDSGSSCTFNGSYGRIYNAASSGIQNFGSLSIHSGVNTRVLGRSAAGIRNAGTANLNNTEVYQATNGIENTGTLYFRSGQVSECNSSGVVNAGNYIMSGGLVHDNRTAGLGGGIFNNGTFTLEGGEVSNNRSANGGGGVYVDKDGTFSQTGGDIYSNQADNGNGGGVYVAGRCTIRGGKISSNTAKGNGGGIYVQPNTNWDGSRCPAALTLSGGTISDNPGTGVYAGNSFSMLENGQVDASNPVYLAASVMIRVTGALKHALAAVITPNEYTLGRQAVSVEYEGKTGKDVLYNANGTKRFVLSPGSYGMLRESNQVKGMANNYILISDTYTIAYDKNSTKDVTGMPGSQEKFWNEDLALQNDPPELENYDFTGWNTREDGSGETVAANAIYDGNADITYYATWKIRQIKVVYDKNGATSGNSYEQITKKPQSYTVLPPNDPAMQLEKEGSTFQGWGTQSGQGAEDALYKPNQLPYTADIRALPSEPGKEYSTVTLYAIWDSYPLIIPADEADNTVTYDEETKTGTITYYEGAAVSKADILSKVKGSDLEDSASGKPLQVKIEKIEYSDRKLKEAYKEGKIYGEEDRATKQEPTKPEEGKDDIPDSFVLDTWKYLIDKADSPVKHTMTLTLTDSVGNKTTEVWTILVKFNEFPTIQAEDRKFYLEEVKDGLLTYQELMSRATAYDQEDGAAVNSSLEIVNYDEELYKNEGGGTYMVLYHVTDSMGKETYRSVSLMVFTKDNPTTDGDRDPDGKPGETKYVRFISSKYYKDENGVPIPQEAGGFHKNSKWLTDESYVAFITEALNNRRREDGTWEHEVESWYFTHEDVLRVQAFVKEYGLGNSKHEDGLDRFLQEFSGNRR